MPKFTVAIAGGGISGLAAAIAISKFNVEKDIIINVYEGAQMFTEIGAGVTVWKRPWDALKKLGLGEELGKLCLVPNISYVPSRCCIILLSLRGS